MRNRMLAVTCVAVCGFAGAASASVQDTALSLLASVPTTLGLKMSIVVALLVLAADRLLAGRSGK